MTSQELKNVLSGHHIDYIAKNSMIIAINVFMYKGKIRSAPVNVTGWAETKMKNWLGY